MQLHRAGIALLSLLAACLSTAVVKNAGTGGGQDSGPPSTWQGAAQEASGSPAAYAFVDDEQGAYFAVVAVLGSSSGAAVCAQELGAAVSEPPQGQWTLEMEVPSAPGKYDVLSAQGDSIYPNIGSPGTGGQGSVVRLLLLASPTSAIQVYPVSGSVSIATAPVSLQDERAGTHLTGSYHLGFPAEPLQASCSFALANYDLGNQVISTDYVCDCVTVEGQTVSKCDGGGGNFSGCCAQSAPAATVVDGTFDAVACPGFCLAPLGLPKACHPLAADAG